MPVENEQVMHVCEMHHVMAHPIIEISSGREKDLAQMLLSVDLMKRLNTEA